MLWPGLAAAVLFASAWRLTGAYAFALAAAASVLVAAVIGALRRLRRADLFAAAAELDRRLGLDALLATGFEAGTGRVTGPLAPAALGEAERAASSVAAETVPLAPPRARYLAVPAAVLAGVVLVPGGAEHRRGGVAYIVAAETGAGGTAAGPGEEVDPREARAEGLPGTRHLAKKAFEDYRKRLARRAERDDRAALPAPPPPRRPLSGRRRRRDVPPHETGGGPGARGDDAGGGGADGGASDDTNEADEGEADGSRGGPGPVDTAEADSIRERFPEYGELIRRYFAGRDG